MCEAGSPKGSLEKEGNDFSEDGWNLSQEGILSAHNDVDATVLKGSTVDGLWDQCCVSERCKALWVSQWCDRIALGQCSGKRFWRSRDVYYRKRFPVEKENDAVK